MGGHGRCFSPGGKSLVMAGMLGATNTSHVSDIFLVVPRDLEVLLSAFPCLERAWPARTGLVEAVTRAAPRAFDSNSRLEVIMAFSNRHLNSFSEATAFGLPNNRDPTGRRKTHCGPRVRQDGTDLRCLQEQVDRHRDQ